MSEGPKRRPWFQIHLLTGVVMMFVGAGMVFQMVKILSTQPGFKSGRWWGDLDAEKIGFLVGYGLIILAVAFFSGVACESLIRRWKR